MPLNNSILLGNFVVPKRPVDPLWLFLTRQAQTQNPSQTQNATAILSSTDYKLDNYKLNFFIINSPYCNQPNPNLT
jgi:hypothetical protein